MQRITAILLLSLQLLTHVGLYQLLKLPVLAQHYYEHQRTNKELSLLSFLKTHYFIDDTRNADYARDQQLPFKTDTALRVILQLPFIPASPPVLRVPYGAVKQAVFVHYMRNLLSPPHYGIFHPPRVS
ncbi:hypothetical protein V9K67_15260 [Paraflavisolibacter sp. H34]|uniref:hypothetical protein n=1 Tax=Huijunlia imazamoxiresistens TaxID=3127457 RepID=UPI00301607FE